jgi:hypothetical protein
VPLGNAGHYRCKPFANPVLERHGGYALAHNPLHLARRVFFQRAISRNFVQLRVGIGRRLLRDHRFNQTLRNRIGEAPVGCGRVRIIMRGKREVPLRGVTRPSQHVLARAHQFHHSQRNVGIVNGVAAFLFGRKALRAPESGSGGSVSP